MSLYTQLFRIAVMVINSPITRQVWTHYTGKPMNARGMYEVASQTRVFQQLQKKAEQGVKAAEEAIKFDPKNPAHYRNPNPQEYNSFAANLKAFKTAFTAAREAVDAEVKGQEYKPSYPINPTHFKPSTEAKPITKPNRMIDV